MKPLKKMLVFMLMSIVLSQCKCKNDDPAPATDGLPAETQTGAGTFGCLVNGKLWKPKGNDGTPNLDLVYDATFAGGNFNLKTYTILDDKGIHMQFMTITMDSLTTVGKYSLKSPSLRGGGYFTDSPNETSACDYTDESVINRTGELEITKLDLKNGIFSGKFYFTITNGVASGMAGCDTIKVTEGRFDIKK